MSVEQGTNLTIIERGSPLDDAPEYVGELRSVRRIWLGGGEGLGADWLHGEVERRVAKSADGWFVVRSERTSVHTGAGAEIATVILEILGAGIAGKVISDLVDYAKAHVRKDEEERGLPDLSPDFSRGGEELAEAVKADLAGVANIPAERLVLVEEGETETFLHSAKYRDSETGLEYVIEIGRQEATMRRIGPAD